MTAFFEELTRLLGSRPDRAWAFAERSLGEDDFRVRVLAHRALADLSAVLPPISWTDAHDALSARLELPRRRAVWSPGELWFPAVHGVASRLVRVNVGARRSGEDRLPLGHEGLAPSFEAARRLLNDPELRFDATFTPNVGWEGDSAGLAVALAAVSAVRVGLDLSLVVATGEINAAGDVVLVGEIEAKQRLCREAAPRATLLVPKSAALGQILGALPASTLAEALDSLGLRDDPEVPLRRVLMLERDGRWEEAAQLAGPLLASSCYSPDQLAELLTCCLAAANHSADDNRQDRITPRLRALVAERLDALDFSMLAQAIGNLAVSAIDTLQPERAAEVLALAPSHSGKSPYRVHLLGPAALLHTLRGEHDLALHLREQALTLAPVDERPRALGDLADALMRVGRGEEAVAQAEEALELATTTPHRQGYQARTTSFLRLHLARALALSGRRDEALAALAPVRLLPGLDPRLRADLLHAELTQDLSAAQGLHQTYGAEGLLRALTLRCLARLGDAAAAAELLALPVFAKLAGLSVDEAARRLPY